MDPKPEQVAAFGREAKRRRVALGLSTREVAARATAILGRTVSRQSVEQWEAGKGTPRQQDKLDAYDQALEADGALIALLAPPQMDERVSRLEGLVDELLDRLRRLEDT